METTSSLLWDLYEKERTKTMINRFFLEGHKPKQSFEDENTLILETEEAFPTVEEAAAKAREYFGKEKDLGLMVIYTLDADGTKEGVRFIFKNDEGDLEESDLYW
ncbi:MAG: hypothetical protein QHH14_04895 [Clostridiales bacterium]|nr:hypothetical protein [Clostridiales bacterium]